jgi:ABC-type nitrate/sulfonate/bicarbonate transport system ATPase subunit
MAAKLQIDDLRVEFALPSNGNGKAPSLTVVHDLSLSVRDKEFVSILGPSGCGKTTLVRCIAGLITPAYGQIALDGMAVTKPSPKMSMVFQGIGLMPWKTVRENVGLGLELLYHRKLTDQDRERVQALIATVGLSGFEDYYPNQLSGGMQQRVGLARALVRNPELLLMDEPFGALDAQTRAILQDELLRLWNSTGSTVFFITHDLDEAIYLSDRVVVLTRRPSHIKQVIDVPLPRPRYNYDARAEPEFARLRHEAWETLKEEIDSL